MTVAGADWTLVVIVTAADSTLHALCPTASDAGGVSAWREGLVEDKDGGSWTS